jgi:hypothetical protein
MAIINRDKYSSKIRQFPGTFEVKKMTINGIDVTDQWFQYDEFENLFSTMSARLTIIDTQNLIKNIPIIGEEIVEVSIDDGARSSSHKWKSYKISDRQFVRHGVLKYVLHLCTEEDYKDSYFRTSKSYHLKKFEDNVKDLLGTEWLDSSKNIILGDTENIRSIVVPYWSPIHAITWMACNARAAEERYRGGNFLFYETSQGYRWHWTTSSTKPRTRPTAQSPTIR